MAGGHIAVVYRQINRLFGSGSVAGLSEGQLLDRFISGRDDDAFEAIVARHGPMVLSVCRSLLRDPNDVDDAFQAVFLVLVRRAPALSRRDLLGGWLYGVAQRVARRARSQAARRREREATGPEPIDAAGSDPEILDARPLIHDEVNRLPDTYREAVILCYFQGRTHEEAALELGWPLGTVKGRLSRARDILRDRLTRRGLVVPLAVIASTLMREGRAAVPPALIGSTASAASTLASRPLAMALWASSTSISPRALALTQGALQAMSATKMKLATTCLVAAGVFSAPAVSGFQFGGPVPPGNRPVATKVAGPDQGAKPPGGQGLADEQAKLAEKTIRLLDEGLKSPSGRYDMMALLRWHRRLLDARVEAGTPRTEALAAYAKAVKAVGQTVSQLRLGESAGITDAEIAEAEFQRIEAEKLLADLKKPSQPPAQPEAAGGGGFGGGAGGGLGGGGMEGPPPRMLPKQDKADSERNKIVEKALEQELTIKFPKGTPLEEILKYVRTHTKDEQSGLPNGVPIYVDPLVLVDENADPPVTKPMPTLVPIDFEGIPLRVTLRLILDQFSLGYQVRDRMVYVMDTELLNLNSEGGRDFFEALGARARPRGPGGGIGGMGGFPGPGGGMAPNQPGIPAGPGGFR
jgi:RNA polymerase sigma factor (sigma-70 family)